MLDLNPETVINKALFDKIIEHLKSFFQKVIEPCNSQMILTEGDLQAWIFHDLLCNLEKEYNLEDETNSKAIGIHCNPRFLNISRHLGIEPDIIILDKKEYSVNSSGSLSRRRKGYDFWGSSIVLELKLFKANYTSKSRERTQLNKWKEDINKLVNLKTNLYPPNKQEQLFSAFVLIGKRTISNEAWQDIEGYATDNNVKPLIFYPGMETA